MPSHRKNPVTVSRRMSEIFFDILHYYDNYEQREQLFRQQRRRPPRHNLRSIVQNNYFNYNILYIRNKILTLKRHISDNMRTKVSVVGGICFAAGMNVFLIENSLKIIFIYQYDM